MNELALVENRHPSAPIAPRPQIEDNHPLELVVEAVGGRTVDPGPDPLAVVARVDGHPIGGCILRSSERLGDAAALQSLVAERIDAATAALPLDRPRSAAPLSVVIPTCDRPESLARCLASVAVLDDPGIEVIVVDNGRQTEPTRVTVEAAAGMSRLPFRYVRCEEPGASRARNAGAAASSGEIIVFTDDDTIVDRAWLQAVALRFGAEPELGMVTGLVLPAELDTEPQQWFEEFGGFGRGNRRATWAMDDDTQVPLFPWSAGRFGSGNNFAIRRAVFERIGGFSQVLGPGTPTRAGEDLDVFINVLWAGESIGYEPSAVVWHHHRREMGELRSQLYNYGRGLAAVAVHQTARHPRRLVHLLARLLTALRLFLSPSSDRNRGRSADFPRELIRDELRGLLAGPASYVHSAGRLARLERPWRRVVADPMVRTATILMAAPILTGALGVAYWGAAARLFPPDVVGAGVSAIAAMTLLSGVAQLNLVNSIPRLLPTAGPRSGRMLAGSYAASGGVAFVIAVAVTGFAPQLFGWSPVSPDLRWWFVAAVVGWTFFTVQDAVLTGLGRAKWVPVENLVFALSKLVLLVVLASADTGSGIFISWTIPMFLALLPVSVAIGLRWLPAHQRTTSSREMPFSTRRLATFLAGDYAGSLLNLATISLLPILVSASLGLTEAGYFTAAWTLAMAFDLLLSALTTAIVVDRANRARGFDSVARQASRLVAVVVVPLVLLLVVAAPAALGLLGPDYADAATGVVRLMALGFAGRAVVMLALARARIEGHVGQLVLIQAAVFAGVVISSIVLLPRLGLVASGLAYAVTQLVVAAVFLPSLARSVRRADR